MPGGFRSFFFFFFLIVGDAICGLAAMSLNSELESEYSYVTEESDDTIDELLKRFTLNFAPRYALKVRDKCGSLVVGADLTFDSRFKDRLAAVLIKPVDRSQWWRRVRLSNDGVVSVRSRKLQWWMFTLDLQADVNPVQRTKDVSFRVATAWDISAGKLHKKSKVHLIDGASSTIHWSVNYDLPEIQGHFSSKQDDHNSDMQASLGYAHADIPKLELSIWPRSLSVRSSKKDELKSLLMEDSVQKKSDESTESSLFEAFVKKLIPR
jgi:hypothetical protein